MLLQAATLWLETLVALVLIGAVGGWSLLPFRRPERPYLFLAAPAAGLAVLGLLLVLLHRVLLLTIPMALLVGAGGSASLTALSARRDASSLRPGALGWPLAVCAGVIAWSVLACDFASIRAGEPTVLTSYGTDTYCYAMTADWRLARAPDVISRTSLDDVPGMFEAMPWFLWRYDIRPAAFSLLAVAAWLRGTSALFSCDWLYGVTLAAGALALAGVIARDRRSLVLLTLAGCTSAWVVTARTGYLGKTLCYPGCVVLAALLLELRARPTFTRCAAGAVLGVGWAMTLNPSVPSGMLATACAGIVASSVVRRGPWPSWRTLVAPVVLWALLCAPAWALYFALGGTPYTPPYPVSVTRAVQASLEIDDIVRPYLDPAIASCLLVAVPVLTGATALVALSRGPPAAFLACSGLVPLAVLTGNRSLFVFHGLIHPFALCGAFLLHEELRGRPRARRLLRAVIALLLLARLPHVSAFVRDAVFDHTWRQPELPVRASELAAIRHVIGARPADLVGQDRYFVYLLQAELALRGTDLRCCPSSWMPVVGDLSVPLVEPSSFPKSPLSIMPPGRSVPQEMVLFRGAHALVVADGEAVTIRSILAREMDPRGATVGCGATPIRIELWNGTGAAARRTLVMDAEGAAWRGPPLPRRVRTRLGGQVAWALVPLDSRETIRVPIVVDPGLSWLELDVRYDPPVQPPPPGLIVLTLADLRLEHAMIDARDGAR